MPTPEVEAALKWIANRDICPNWGVCGCDSSVNHHAVILGHAEVLAQALRESDARVKELESRHENLVPERDQARAEAFCFRQERDEQKARAEKAEAELSRTQADANDQYHRFAFAEGLWAGAEDKPKKPPFALALNNYTWTDGYDLGKRTLAEIARLRAEVERLRKVVDVAKEAIECIPCATAQCRIPIEPSGPLCEVCRLKHKALAALEEGHGG